MGRSPLFEFKKYVEFLEELSSSDELTGLLVGQRVNLNIKSYTTTPVQRSQPMTLCRSISTYDKYTSSTQTTLVVDHIDFDTDFNEHGIRCIVLRDPDISIENHMYAWCVTTDGYLREIEHYGIIGKVLDVEIMN